MQCALKRQLRNRAMLAATLATALTAPALAQTSVSGPASALDGDSLSVSGLSVRLFGIDAPELKQTCSRAGTVWNCGEQAKAQLQSLVEGRQVHCVKKTIDDYGRAVSICSVEGVDLGKTMVSFGWAVSFSRYGTLYESDQLEAKTARLGIWDSDFELPQDYRARNRQAEYSPTRPAPVAQPARPARAPQTASFSGCVIKGNRNRRGQWIYHLPGMPYYGKTRAEEWFCTEAEAQAAGYRRAIVK